MIEKIQPQKTKEFTGKKQDHGDAAQRRGHGGPSFWEAKYDRRIDAKLENEQIKTALTDEVVDYDSMSSAELESEADKLLGLEAEDTYYESLEVSDEAAEESEEASDGEITNLEEAYKYLVAERDDLIKQYPSAFGARAVEMNKEINELDQQIAAITGMAMEAVQDFDLFATEADFGVKSKSEISRLMARRVTLDPEFEHDDDGDSDFASPVRIKNRL